MLSVEWPPTLGTSGESLAAQRASVGVLLLPLSHRRKAGVVPQGEGLPLATVHHGWRGMSLQMGAVGRSRVLLRRGT